jgi:NADH:ubiquinone oxidoreductase subunit 4 (subunit M)
MSILDTIALIFFLSNLVIFFAKMLNVMTYEYRQGDRNLKYYGKEMSIVLFVVSLLAWLFVFSAFSIKAADTQFLETYGIPATDYIEYGIYLSLTNVFVALNLLFTLAELILLFWKRAETEQERFRRGAKERQPRKVALRQYYK